MGTSAHDEKSQGLTNPRGDIQSQKNERDTTTDPPSAQPPTPSSYEFSLQKNENYEEEREEEAIQPASPINPEDQDTKMGKDDGGQALSKTTTEEEHYITGFKLVLVIVPVCLVAFLMLLDISIVTTAIPRITSDFHSLVDVGWYGSAYLLACASLQPLAGKLYTTFATKWTFLSFFFVFELGSLVCALSKSSKMLIVGRAVAGMGSSGLMNGALTIIAQCVPLHKRPAYLGGMMGIAQMGVVVGPLIGGAFTEYTTWRWCFYVNLPIGGVVSLLVMSVKIPDRDKKRELSLVRTILTKLDLMGFVLFAPSAIQFFLALQWGGNQYPWNSATVIGLFCGSGGTFIVFLVWEYFKGDEAMIPFSMVRKRAVWSSCVVQIFFFGMLQLAVYYLPIYFQTVKGASPLMSGVYLLPSVVSQLIAAVSSGLAVTKMGYYLPWSLASSIIAAIAHGLFSTLTPSTSTGKWVGYQILLGFGRGIGMQMPIIAIQNTVSPKLISISMSLLAFAQIFGGAVLLTLGDTVFTNSLRSYILTYAKGVNPQAVIDAGATGIRTLITNPTLLAEVLLAYSKSIDRVFYLMVGCSCACFIFGWGMGWKDIRKKPKKTSEEPKSEEPQNDEPQNKEV